MGSCSAAARAAGVAEREFRPEGGESWTDVEARAADFWRFLVAKHSSTENVEPLVSDQMVSDGPSSSKLPHIIVVTHSGFIQSLLCYLSQQGVLQIDLSRAVMHASLTTLCVCPPACMRLVRTNDVAHLKGLAKSVRSPTQEYALKVQAKPMKRSIATSPPRAMIMDFALLRRTATATAAATTTLSSTTNNNTTTDDRPAGITPAAAVVAASSPEQQRRQQST